MQICCFCFAGLLSNEPMEKSFKWHYKAVSVFRFPSFFSIFVPVEDAVHKELRPVSDIIIAASQWAFFTFQHTETIQRCEGRRVKWDTWLAMN